MYCGQRRPVTLTTRERFKPPRVTCYYNSIPAKREPHYPILGVIPDLIRNLLRYSDTLPLQTLMADKDPPSLTPPEGPTPRRRFARPSLSYPLPFVIRVLPYYSTHPRAFLFFSKKHYFCLFKKPMNEPRPFSNKVTNGNCKRLQEKL